MVRFGMPRPGSQLCYSFSLLLFVLLGAGTASTFGSDSTHLLREDIYKAAAIGNGNGNTNGVETLRSISESASLLRRSIPILIQRLGDDSASVLDFVGKVNPHTILLGHGEEDSRAWFEARIRERHPRMKIIQPQPGLAVEV